MKENSTLLDQLNNNVFNILTPDNNILSVILLIISLTIVSVVLTYTRRHRESRYKHTRKYNHSTNSDEY